MSETKEQLTISFDDALGYLPEGEDIHTFMNPGGMLVGADWSRGEVIAALRAAPEILITGDTAQGMKHGLAIEEEGRTIFIETTRPTDESGASR